MKLKDNVSLKTQKIIGVVFSSTPAREFAQSLLARQINAHALIVAPNELATCGWIKQAMHHFHSVTVHSMQNGQLNNPLDILAAVDTLCIISNEPALPSDSDLKLSDSVEELLWLALDLNIETHYYPIGCIQPANPESCLKMRRVPDRVNAKKAQRTAFTRQLREIRLDNDFGSTGLWDKKGRNLAYDLLDLPFPLLRRIAAWQRNYDDTLTPPSMDSEAWWTYHQQETLALAKALQTILGSQTTVKLHHQQGWLSIADFPEFL